MKSSNARYLHIIPVGTSILVNYGWKPGAPLPPSKELSQWLASDPRARSAELNATLHFVHRGLCTHAHLIGTNTPEGKLCMRLVSDYLRTAGIKTTGPGAVAGGLLPPSFDQPATPDDFYAGVCRFREFVFRAILSHAPKIGYADVFINATGGLKPMAALAAIVAAELGIKAYYIHQTMSEPVFLPTAAVHPALLRALRKLHSLGGRCRAERLPGVDLAALQREGLATVSHKPSGEPRNVKLTAYGKFLAKRYSSP